MAILKTPFLRANRKVSDSFQAYLVDGANFTGNEEYPIIPADFISKDIPKDIMPFDKAINYRGDLSKTYICFYAPDNSFERIRKNPKKYLKFFKRTAGIIGFDYSIHTDMQIIKQKSQINDNLSLTYYYGRNGIPVIPNIRCGIYDLLPEFETAIPKGSNIAIGTHGFIKEMREKYEWYCFIDKIIRDIKPANIIVYGTLSSQMFDELRDKSNFVFFDSWIDKRRKGELKYAD